MMIETPKIYMRPAKATGAWQECNELDEGAILFVAAPSQSSLSEIEILEIAAKVGIRTRSGQGAIKFGRAVEQHVRAGVVFKDRLDAARWRAFIGSQRIRIIGSAGVHDDAKPNGEPYDGYAHFGMEIWTKYGSNLSPEQTEKMRQENEYGCQILTKYADIAIHLQQSQLRNRDPVQAELDRITADIERDLVTLGTATEDDIDPVTLALAKQVIATRPSAFNTVPPEALPLPAAKPEERGTEKDLDAVTYTVDGVVYSPLEYISFLHDQLNKQTTDHTGSTELRLSEDVLASIARRLHVEVSPEIATTASRIEEALDKFEPLSLFRKRDDK